MKKCLFPVVGIITLQFFLYPVLLEAQEAPPEGIEINFDVYSTLEGSGIYYLEGKNFNAGFDAWLNVRVDGKLGKSVSYFADIGVSLLYAKRNDLGYWGVKIANDFTEAIFTEPVKVYSQPLAYFPYSYNGAWGGFLFPLKQLTNSGGMVGWPDMPSVGFNLLSEIRGIALNDILQWSIGRTGHEAASVIEGNGLVLNKTAQPFFGYDIQLSPVPWLKLYSVSGFLEYFNSMGMQSSAEIFQNTFTLSMFTINYREYVQIDVGSSAVCPKRFELAYLFPLTFPLLYQNFVGDFDNLTMFGNLKLQYPNLGFIWLSGFLDETNFDKPFFNLDRNMYALQGGLQYQPSFLASSSLTASYTKIEPYCYTHQKVEVPWYNHPMEQAYVNHGYGLGHYLPPNSDEIKVMFDVKAKPELALKAQFQLIRHGAEYGSSMVDGSSYASELQERNRSGNPALRKFFLNDGAYQWFYIAKVGTEWNLPSLPFSLSLYGEAGAVLSYFTDINGTANDGKKHEHTIIDTSEYPKSTGIVINMGLRISPQKAK
jgi:hypothetical protein